MHLDDAPSMTHCLVRVEDPKPLSQNIADAEIKLHTVYLYSYPRQTESSTRRILRARRPSLFKRNKSMSIRAAMALACIGTTVYAATDTSSLNPWLADMEYSVRGEVRCFCMSARGIKRMCRSIVLHYIPAKMYMHILSVATAAVPCK